MLLTAFHTFAGEERVAISSLLAVGRVHHHLVRSQARSRVGLLVEGGEIRDVHHFCTLIGYGADAICPYLAFETLGALREDGMLKADESDDALATKYIKVSAAPENFWRILLCHGLSRAMGVLLAVAQSCGSCAILWIMCYLVLK